MRHFRQHGGSVLYYQRTCGDLLISLHDMAAKSSQSFSLIPTFAALWSLPKNVVPTWRAVVAYFQDAPVDRQRNKWSAAHLAKNAMAAGHHFAAVFNGLTAVSVVASVTGPTSRVTVKVPSFLNLTLTTAPGNQLRCARPSYRQFRRADDALARKRPIHS